MIWFGGEGLLGASYHIDPMTLWKKLFIEANVRWDVPASSSASLYEI